jgi:hypothetical protein
MLYGLRDHFLFNDHEPVKAWLNVRPNLADSLITASEQIDLIFGLGRSKWLTVIEDWEGTSVLRIEVEFSGSGEDASKLCRRFAEEWSVNQSPEIRQMIDLGVCFV